MENKDLRLKRAMRSVLIVMLLSAVGLTKLQAQNITFADANVKAICVANWDTDGDSELSQAEAAAVTSLDGVFMFDDEITTFDELSFFTALTALGDDEFNSCTSLTAISIPNTVTSIGNYAFSDCIGLTSVTSYAFTPPVLGSNVFDNVPSDLVINVPCGTSALYQVANGWSGLSNYEEFVFDLCPITFADENVKAICVTHWDTNGDGELSYSEAAAVTNLATHFKSTNITSFDELEYFTSMTSLQNTAFYGCTSLVSITLPSSVSALGNGSFYNCTSLAMMTVYAETPPTVGTNAFKNVPTDMAVQVLCEAYEAYLTANGWSEFANLQGFGPLCPITFADANVKALCVANWDTDNDGELSYAEAAAVTSLGEVFRNQSSISSFNELQYFIGLTSIGDYAFYYCTGLTSVELPSSVTSIGDYAFYYCTSLTTVELPNSLTSIGSRAFASCRALTSIELPNSVTSIGSFAFSSCDGLVSVELPNSVTSIGSYAFSSCTGLTTVELPNSLTSIGGSVFYYCTGLTTVELPNSLTSIGSGVFESCYAMTSIELPNSLTSIGSMAFASCRALTSIELPNSVTSIGTTSFKGCNGLEQIVVASDNAYFDSRDNSNAIINTSTNVLVTGCKNTLIPNTVTSIGDYAFYYCTGLTSVELPSSVTSIGDCAFYYCTGLTSLELPNSLTSIGGSAFSSCTGLTSVASFADTPPTLDNDVFYGVKKNIPVYVPCGTSEAYQGISGWNMFSNIMGMCDGEVVVTTNPSDGGTVTGAGYYSGGDVCILTATPNQGYIFGNWTENGRAVSSDSVYRFYAHPATIEAYFCSNNPITFVDANVKAICVNKWDTNSDGELSYVEAAAVTDLGQVFKNKSTITSFNELQFFISLTSIGYSAFSNCTSLTSVVIPNSVTSIGYSAFSNCTSLTSVVIPNSVTSISDSAFSNCSNLTSVTIGNSVTSIGKSAFSSCTNLISLIIGSSVTLIDKNAFSNCKHLNSIAVLAETPPSVLYVNFNPFPNVPKNIPVYVPCDAVEDYQTTSSWSCFTNIIGMCSGEVSVTVNPSEGGTVTGAGYYTGGEVCVLTATPNEGFGFVSWMENGKVVSMDSICSFYAHPTTIVAIFCFDSPIVFADTIVKALCVANWDTNGDGELSYAEAARVTSLGEVFKNNSSITTFDELQYFINLTTIDNYAFSSCTSLTSVTIGNSVSQIGSSAFSNCNCLNFMTVLAETPPSVGYYTFNNVPTNIPVYVLCDAVEDYQTAIGWSHFTNIIGMCSGEVSVTVNPSEGGTVTGAGYYTGGEVCVLTATPNEGFSFASWMENGRVVSMDSVYTFYAHPIAIVANFCSNSPIVFADANVKALCVANWDTNGDGELSYAEAAKVTSLGEVFRENAVISTFDELQYFVGLSSIGRYAFCYCTDLTSVGIPNSVSEIGSAAFDGCSNLTSIAVWAEYPPVLEYGYEMEEWEWKEWVVTGSGIPFEFVDKFIPVYVPCGSLEAYQNANGWYEFTNFLDMCSGEVAVEVNPLEGGVVTGAGYYSGGELCELTAIPNPGYGLGNWIENGVVVSSDTVYSFLAHVTTITANFCSISPIVFTDANVKNLCVANWDTNGDGELSYAEAANVMSLGEVFKNNSSISSFDELQYFIGLTSIGNNAFRDCSGLTSIDIPNSVISIGNSAFYGCTDLTSIEVPNSVTSIGDWAFSFCTGLTSIVIPNSVTLIGSNAFSDCSGLTSIIIPNSVTTIEYYAFSDCSGLTSIEIPNSVSIIEHGVFYGCSGLTSVEIPNSVTSIGNSAFSGCSGLTSIEIPNSVTSIGYYAFYGCSGLTSIEIPNSVNTIGYSAFSGCSGLTEVLLFGTTPSTLEYDAFYGSTCPIYVPYESLNDYKTATYWISYQSRIFPMSYITIPGYGEIEGNYRFIASPLVDSIAPTSVDNLITETAYDLYRFSPTDSLGEWQNYKAHTDDLKLVNGQGYLYANENEVNIIFKGEFNEDVTKEVNLVYDAGDERKCWNLVGNPFPVSAYLNRPYYVMNEDGSGLNSEAIPATTPIPPCTAVFVKAVAEGETVVFTRVAP